MTRVTDTSGTTRFHYDARGNVTSKLITVSGLSPTYTYSYVFNDRDLVTQKTFPDATQVYTYSRDSVLTDITHNGTSWGKMAGFNAFKQPGQRFAFWDSATLTWANTATYAYDAGQRLARLRLTQKNGSTLHDTSYKYDAAGNLTSIIDNRASKIIGGVNTDLTKAYAYDALDRLCKVGGTSCAAPTYTYDGIGNLLTDAGTTNSYTTSGTNRILENKTGVVVNWRATHDSEGKRTSFMDCFFSPCITMSYGYDYKGRLQTVTKDGIVRERYDYDSTDMRTKKAWLAPNSGTTTSWFIGSDYVVRQTNRTPSMFATTLTIGGFANDTFNPSGISGPLTATLIDGQVSEATVRSNQYQPFLGDVLAGPPQGIYLRHPDHLGTPALMTQRGDGSEVSRYATDSWGVPDATRSVGYDTSNEKFTDKPFEQCSELAYHGGRFYHPKSKRFITADDRVTRGGAQATTALPTCATIRSG